LLQACDLQLRKHDFSQEISACKDNVAVVRIIEGKIVKMRGATPSGKTILGLKASTVHKNESRIHTIEQLEKMTFALGFSDGLLSKLGSPALVCFGEKGVVSRHFAQSQ